jgi:hypothetical protein
VLREVEPELGSLSGEALGNGYFVVAMAYFKLDNSTDGCTMAEKAKPLVRGTTLTQLTPFLDACK